MHDEIPRITEQQENYDPKRVKLAHYSNELKSEVAKYLGDKLAKKINVPSIKVPWSKMKEGDIINWPSDVKFAPISKLKVYEVERLSELAKEDKLDFSLEFLKLKRAQFSNYTLWTPEFLVQEIETTLCEKLNSGTNKTFRQVPWSILKKDDMINWPQEIPLKRLPEQWKKHLSLLYRLKEEIFFSKEFLETLSDPRFDRTSIGRQIIQQGEF
jgi:hypothetical protein